MARKRRALSTRLRVAAALGAALTLGGCNFLDAQGMTFTVVNNTDQKLEVRLAGQPQAPVNGHDSVVVYNASPSCIAAGQLDATTEDGEFVANHPTKACDGETWTIEQSDLVPAPEPSPSGSPAP